MDLFFSVREAITKGLNDDKAIWSKWIKLAEEKTGLERSKMALGAAVFLGFYLVFGFGGQLVCNFIGFIYPAYCSMRAIETSSKEDDTKWLTYWVVFACFSLVEYFADFIAGWFPGYWLVKCVFLIWCFIPIENNGSVVIYKQIIRPKFIQNQGRVDNLINDAKNKAMGQIFKSD